MSEPSFRKGLKAIAARKLVFNMSVFSSQLFAVAELAKAAPEITLALEHFGWPVATDPEAFAAWKSGMAAVAACPNVSVKVPGFWAIDRAWRAEAVEPWLKETYALFGPQRCMLGSNLPIEKLMCPLPEQWRFYRTFWPMSHSATKTISFAARPFVSISCRSGARTDRTQSKERRLRERSLSSSPAVESRSARQPLLLTKQSQNSSIVAPIWALMRSASALSESARGRFRLILS